MQEIEGECQVEAHPACFAADLRGQEDLDCQLSSEESHHYPEKGKATANSLV